jgi:diguanylate cyclase (GGDEF)-like protein
MISAPGQIEHAAAATAELGFAPYAQLAKMLVPSIGTICVYDGDGDLIWSSDGYASPEFSELVEDLRKQEPGSQIASVRSTSSGLSALAAPLVGDGFERLGYVIIELAAERVGGHAMAANLLKPVIECLRARLNLEQARPAPTATIAAGDLDFLIGVSEIEQSGGDSVRHLLTKCVDNLDCVSAAFVAPDQNISVIVHRAPIAAGQSVEILDRTQKHLLAWAQLNNRPMVVNRVGAGDQVAPYKILSCPVRDNDNEVTGLIALFRPASGQNFELRDVHLLEFLCRRAVGLLKQRSDVLTGLMNRKAFEQQLESFAGRNGQSHAGTLLHLDIDRLHAINDAFGLDAGDEVIKRLADLVTNELGNDGIACRISGDRFAAFFPSSNDADAEGVANRLLNSMSRLGYLRAGQSVPVSISIGIAAWAKAHRNARHLIAAAELAGKRARQAGGNRYALHIPSTLQPPSYENELIAAASLQTALQSNEFRLVAQPIVALDTSDKQVVGYEVLVRMRDASGTMLSPDRFMNAARKFGLSLAVDMWVFAQLLRELEELAPSPDDVPVGIAVNVSEQSLLSSDYRNFIQAEIARSTLPGSIFSFEISESAAVSHMDSTEAFIDAMKAIGSKVALDNFGSGLTSFSHLRRLRIDYLKVHGELIRGILDDRHLESMVYGLAKAAESLEVKTIAEHVENEQIADKLTAMGFVYAQGFAFGRPQPLRRALSLGCEGTIYNRPIFG